jgi:hypothetical protein
MKTLTITREAHEAFQRAYYAPNSRLKAHPFSNLDNSSTIHNPDGTVSWPSSDDIINNLNRLAAHWNLSVSDALIRLIQERATTGLQ